MKQLLHPLFVTSEDVYLALDGENVVAQRGEDVAARYPLARIKGSVWPSARHEADSWRG